MLPEALFCFITHRDQMKTDGNSLRLKYSENPHSEARLIYLSSHWRGFENRPSLQRQKTDAERDDLLTGITLPPGRSATIWPESP